MPLKGSVADKLLRETIRDVVEISLLLLINCGKYQADRNNVYDPKSNYYIKPPDNIQTVNVNESSITLKWSYNSSDNYGYYLYYNNTL